MIVKRMTATFGRLEGETLELTEGLNIITAPNEWGKSTWCAFLRAMFYGIPTRERDSRTTLAEKNRYAPWSGAPMAGEMDLLWKGREITLRRFPKGASPFGGFEAVDTATGAPVTGLTGENCGEVLLGVGRETYQRSAFVGQDGVPIDGDPDLEKRIAALVSSGEEDVSFSETERTLKGWLNRRRHNKTGLIPKLEGELEAVETGAERLRQLNLALADGAARRADLVEQRTALEAEAAAQKARQEWAMRERYAQALAELETARAELAALEGETVPEKEALRAGQGDLAYWNTLEAQKKEARTQLGAARSAAQAARAALADPVFHGMTPEEAWAKATADAARMEKKTIHPALCGALAVLWLALGLLWLGVSGDVAYGAGSLALCVCWIVLAWRNQVRRRAQRELRAAYGVTSAQEVLERGRDYQARCAAVRGAEGRVEVLETSFRTLTDQQEELWAALLEFVHTFAPEVTDIYGASAALSRALSVEERRMTARVKVETAQKLVSSVPYAPAPTGGPLEPPPPAARPAAATAALLTGVREELARLDQKLAALEGRRSTMGDLGTLEARRDALAEELERRRGEHAALTLALETLSEANGDLQARFSPELNRRAGELFAQLTGGKYDGLTLTREFEAAARSAGDVLPRRALSLSRGTVDQLYLAVRLAVCQLALPEEDPPPLVLDDALAAFDDGRMALALELLAGLSRQVILFTCHDREAAWQEGCNRRENGV